MKTTLIIGYGNVLRRDDGLGIYVIEALQNRLKDPDYAFITAHQLQPEMIEQIVKVDNVIFVDADNGLPAGNISQFVISNASDFENRVTTLSGTHLISPEWLLYMGEKFYGHRPMAVIFSMSGADFSLGEGFSPIVNARLSEFVALIYRFIVHEVNPLKMR